MAVFDLAGKASGRPLWSLLGAEQAEPVACNATLVARRARRGRRRRRALGRARLRRPSSSSSAPATTSPRCGRSARRLGPEARIRVDANGAWSVDEALGVLQMIEPLGIELVEQPVADARGMAEVTARDVRSSIAADESVERAKDAERRQARRGLRPGDGEAAQGRRDRRGERDRRGSCRSTSRARSTARSGSPPPRTRRRRCRSTGPAAGLAHGPRDPAAVLGDDRQPRVHARRAQPQRCPTAPASASSSTRRRSQRTGSSVSARRWTRPTATPRSPRRWSRSWRAAASARR